MLTEDIPSGGLTTCGSKRNNTGIDDWRSESKGLQTLPR